MESLSNSVRAEELIRKNLDRIRQEIDEACKRSGRASGSVKLVYVTKNVTPAIINILSSLGVSDIGENRVQEAQEKFKSVVKPFNWHMIGHLQTNKAKKAIEIFSTIHSIDSERLAQKLNEELKVINKTITGFLQVNFTQDRGRSGVEPNEAENIAKTINSECKRINLIGLMTMAEVYENPEKSRPIFKELGKLSQRCGLAELSMGMSDDYAVAIEEGATIIRIGRRIFEGIQAIK